MWRLMNNDGYYGELDVMVFDSYISSLQIEGGRGRRDVVGH